MLAGHYRTGTLSVAPQFVEPPADALAGIKAEVALKDEGICERARRSRYGAAISARR